MEDAQPQRQVIFAAEWSPSLRFLAVLSGFTVLTAIFFWPWLAHLSSALIGPPEDNMQDFWNSWHAATAHGWRDFLYTTQIRFPEGTPLTYHSFAWPQILAVAGLTRIFGDDFPTLVALHNLTLLASFPLAATAMFYLARHLLGAVPGRDAASAVAGFIFAFSPWHVAQVMHHAHVSTIEFFPLFVLFYLLALERKSYPLLAVAAFLQAINALSCWYFFFYAFYFMVFHFLAQRVQSGKYPRGWPMAAPLLCSGFAALLLTPWLVPMLRSDPTSSFLYFGTNMFVADLAALVTFPPTHLLARWGHDVYAALTGNAWEGAVYLGLANLALLGWALTGKGNKRILYYGLAGMGLFLIVAIGDRVHVAGYVTKIQPPGVLLGIVPILSNIRTPARAMLLVSMFLGLALAQASLLVRDRHRRASRAALALVLILMLLDFTPVHLASTPADCPAVLKTIASDPGNFGVLDLPRGYGESNAAMMASVCHGKPVVQGETARRIGFTLADRLEVKDLSLQRQQLAAAHVRYIVLHRPQDNLFQWTGKDGNIESYLRAYPLVQEDGDMTVLRVY
jgi:hypothetical protein